MVRRWFAALAASAVVLLAPGPALAAEDEPTSPADALARAVRWLGRQQVDDGGFDGFIAGGGTPDAVLALAESAQTTGTWGNRQAVERVEAEESRDGKTPLDAVRRLARRNQDPAVAGRLLVRVALPLGLDPSDEGPLGDLVGPVADALGDEDVAFGVKVELAVALLSAGGTLPDGLLDQVTAAQQPDGGWSRDGDPEAERADLATTGAAVDLLVLAGLPTDSPAVVAALGFVAASRTGRGTWTGADGEPSAVATAGAIRAIRAVGHDPDGSCWETSQGRDPGRVSATEALVGLQADDGSFGGEDPVPTAAEAIHALSGRWLPRGRAATACQPDGGGFPVEPSLLVLGAIAVIGVGGGLRILRSAPSAY